MPSFGVRGFGSKESKASYPPCFHCGLESDPEYTAKINDQDQAFCCIGCQAVAQAISAGGLSDFYQYRDAQNLKPEIGGERFDAYDLEEVQSSFVTKLNDQVFEVKLLVGGISCAACAWLIENYLSRIAGIDKIRVNAATHRCHFEWNSSESKLSEVFAALHKIGYRPQPGTEAQSQLHRKNESRNALLRIGVAGLGMMQVGMVGVALHAGDIQGIDNTTQHFLRWVSLIFAIPVMLYSARPFFINAYRALKIRHLNMDVPVSLALILAFWASVYGTFTNTGEVYFDSVSMFTFFLLVGRYLEMRARHTSVYETERLSQLLPVSVERYTEAITQKNMQADSELELVPLTYIKPGDFIRVSAGSVIPCDGELVSELAASDESLLTGESDLVHKHRGDKLYAGAMLAEPTATIQVSACGAETKLSSVQALLDQAIENKPKQQQMADSVARYFVAAVLVCFVCVFGAWYFIDSSRAFWVALSVLVVTCPCALSLATPAALAAGLNKLRGLGLLVISPSALETLPKITHIAFDKTGTLTLGEPRLQVLKAVEAGQEIEETKKQEYIELVAALEAFSRHPIARAFSEIKSRFQAKAVNVETGRGIEGNINGDVFRFGVADYACSEFSGDYPSEGKWQLLSKNNQAIAWFLFADEARENLLEGLGALKKQGVELSLLSGDRSVNIDVFVDSTNIKPMLSTYKGSMLPEDKLRAVQERQKQGDKVTMVGDGINDVPVLAGADLSVAMGSASQLAKVNADAVLLNQNLLSLSEAREVAGQVNSVIRQNFAWALGYNLVALPAAAMGFIPPYLAAVGMSLSSLIVVLNSLRVNRGS